MESYSIHLENFDGPLDLLLHLIKKNEMDICDIQIAEITGQYLSIIDTMKTLNLDVAGEFLLMAASLIHIKSKMLLPKIVEDDDEEPEEDPRAELVRRLLEYQKYKDASESLDELPQLNRDIYTRLSPEPEVLEENDGEFVAVGLFDLLEALQEVLRERDEPLVHEVSLDHLSVTDRVNMIMTRLHGHESMEFCDLFPEGVQRNEVIVTFLAMLELVKLRAVRFMQNTRFGSIWIFPSVEIEDIDELDIGEDNLGYS